MHQSVSNISLPGSLAAGFFLAGAWLCMFPPENALFQWWSAQALYVALGYLGMAIFFLIFNRFRLMFICLACSAAVSFFYDRPEAPEPPTTKRSVSQPVLPHESAQAPA